MVVLMMIDLHARVLLCLSLLGAGALPVALAHHEIDEIEVIEVTAERFSFTPSEIRTKPGATLEFRLRSDDTNHGFRILGTDIKVIIPKRGQGVQTVRFTPDKPGRYTFECAKLCGAGHSFMRGVIIVAE
jgi:cytochrome c oxidase subunit II